MADLDLTWEGLSGFEQRLALLRRALRDLRPFWPRVANLEISWISRNFDTEGAFGLGRPWTPLTTEYAAAKAKLYPGKRILSATGALRRAATTPARAATPSQLILEIEPYERDGRTIGPDWFQEGTTRMPARPLLFDLNAVMETELEQAASDYIDEIADSLGL